MPHVHAVEHSACDGIGGEFFLKRDRSLFKIERDRGGQHLDVADFFGSRVEQHVAILRRSARTPGLKEVLHTNADFAFNTADGLLQHAGKDGIGLFNAHGKLETLIAIKHG